ncbi:hypothetical protein [Novosphingobium resinovorum]|uniref:hypothetical protein n=1 Tax=Novosphingobium resinovorum TaxID=158500 RepID=UPI002ED69B24|nr:hypothetical protein [Novosphingobium resinovorum]
MSLNAIEIERCRAEIGATARAMLSGECSYISGARAICGLFQGARVDGFAEPFLRFVAINSETDAVPVGTAIARWHPDAKIKHQAEWDEAESYAKAIGEPACRAAVIWVDEHPTYGN